MTPRKKDALAVHTPAPLETPPADMSIDMQSAQGLLTLAVQKGADVETLERLMDLRDRVMKEQAKMAFNKAMAEFQAECPVIAKTKEVKTNDGKLAYKYAPIESAVAQVKELVQKHGFRYTTTMKFNQNEQGEKTVIAYCRVVHELGHEEVSEMEVPLGTKTQIMSSSQVVAAASTFAKRYAFLNAFGIMTGDDDNDTADQRADAPGRAPSKKQEATPSPAAPAPQQPATKKTPPRRSEPGNPYYDPDSDDGSSMTPKQRAFLVKRWNEYMDKSSITGDEVRADAFRKIVAWAFQKFNKHVTPENITVTQASYLIDYIPTMPVKKPGAPAAQQTAPKEESFVTQDAVVHKVTMPAPAPSVPPKPKTLSPEEITARIDSLKEMPDIAALEDAWKTILEEKKQGLLGGNFFKLHQAYIRAKGSMK